MSGGFPGVDLVSGKSSLILINVGNDVIQEFKKLEGTEKKVVTAIALAVIGLVVVPFILLLDGIRGGSYLIDQVFYKRDIKQIENENAFEMYDLSDPSPEEDDRQVRSMEREPDLGSEVGNPLIAQALQLRKKADKLSRREASLAEGVIDRIGDPQVTLEAAIAYCKDFVDTVNDTNFDAYLKEKGLVGILISKMRVEFFKEDDLQKAIVNLSKQGILFEKFMPEMPYAVFNSGDRDAIKSRVKATLINEGGDLESLESMILLLNAAGLDLNIQEIKNEVQSAFDTDEEDWFVGSPERETRPLRLGTPETKATRTFEDARLVDGMFNRGELNSNVRENGSEGPIDSIEQETTPRLSTSEMKVGMSPQPAEAKKGWWEYFWEPANEDDVVCV